MIQYNQFEGIVTKDSHTHLGKFMQIYENFKLNKVLDEVVKL